MHATPKPPSVRLVSLVAIPAYPLALESALDVPRRDDHGVVLTQKWAAVEVTVDLPTLETRDSQQQRHLLLDAARLDQHKYSK